MKWIFLINNASFLMEVFGRLAFEAIEEGNECLGLVEGKIAEYKKKNFFPPEMRLISRVDWCIENYQRDKKEFGGLSWRNIFFVFDRLKHIDFSYGNSLEMISQNYQFFESIFEKEKPDVVISEPPSGLFNGVAYYFCRQNKLPYFGLMSSRFKDRIDVYDLEGTCSKYEKTFKEINENDISNQERQFAQNFADNFISHKELPSYVGSEKIYFTQLGFIKHYWKRIKKLGRFHFQYFLHRSRFKKFDYESENILKDSIWAPFNSEKRKFRILFQKNFFNYLKNFDSNQKFFLFPLQFQPESSTSVSATYFSDQLNTIKNTAFALPLPYKLYVKEHPVAVGTHSANFYKELKKVPNVVLFSPQESTKNLIEKSSGVVVLTTTVGMEAALAGKPVYVLGDAFYSYHPLCRKIKSFEELKNSIEADLGQKYSVENLQDINCRFIISYFRNTIPGIIAGSTPGSDINDYKLMYKCLKLFF